MRNATPATTPTAAPCVRCGSTGGYIPRDCLRPKRTKGYCDHCAKLLHERAAIHGYANREEADAALPYGEAQRHLVNPYDARVRGAVAHRRAQARVAARQRRFDAHVGAFLPAPPVVTHPIPWPREWGNHISDPLARAEWEAEERAIWSRSQDDHRAA